MTTKRKTGLLLAALLLAALAFWMLYKSFAPQGDGAPKTITVEIVVPDFARSLTIETTQPMLRGALEQQGLIAGEESPTGLFVTTVDGVAADPALQQWWCFTRDGGQELTAGVDQTPVEDGVTYEITLRTGW